MKNLFLYVFVILISFFSLAQKGWNWPEDEGLQSKAMEKQAYYKILIAQDKFTEAMDPLNWLYQNNPNLNPSIYIEGVICLNKIINKVENKKRKERLQDSLLWLYDQRIKYFNNRASILDRKVFKAFQFYYKEPSKYDDLIKLYEIVYEINGAEVSYFNLNTYMLIAKLYHMADPQKMPAEKVLDIHSQISDIIDQKLQNKENAEKLQDQQNKTDAWLASIPGLLTCNFIEKHLVPKFRANPSDLAMAKKIFKYSVQAKCTKHPYFLEASEPVFKKQPSFNLANIIGEKYLEGGDWKKALEYYTEAGKLAGTNDEKYDAYLGQAIVNSKKGNKIRARYLAYEALKAKPGSPAAYILIGNLYFTSFDDCRGDKSKVLDRGVFLAAYKAYEKAGNRTQMQASKEQFPSIEDIFNEGYKEGQTVTVGCWINEPVTLQRR